MAENALEIGPGKQRTHKDWITFGLDPYLDIDVVGKWEDGLPWNENTFDLVYASHVLEHIPWYQTIDVLTEAYRVIRHGELIEIWVPDFEKIVRAWLDGHTGEDRWRRFNPDNRVDLWMNGRVFTYGQHSGNWHKAAFRESWLRHCLYEAGFRYLVKLKSPRGYDHGWINLGIRGVKP